MPEFRRRLRGGGLLCAAVLAALVVAAAVPELLGATDPLAQDVAHRLQPPGPGHLLGTDGLGRDVLSRVAHGTRLSLGCALVGVAGAALAGIPLGFAAAWHRRLASLVASSLVTVLASVPFLLLAMVIVISLGPSFLSVAAAVATGLVAPVARLSAAAAGAVLRETWVEAARAGGAGPGRILVRYVLPHALSPLVAHLTSLVGTAVSAETTLSYLGLGIPAPWPSWGRMLQEGARQYLEAAPWVAGSAGAAVLAATLSVAVLGDALRDRAAGFSGAESRQAPR